MYLYYLLRFYVRFYYGKASLRVLTSLLSYVQTLERTLQVALTKKLRMEK